MLYRKSRLGQFGIGDAESLSKMSLSFLGREKTAELSPTDKKYFQEIYPESYGKEYVKTASSEVIPFTERLAAALCDQVGPGLYKMKYGSNKGVVWKLVVKDGKKVLVKLPKEEYMKDVFGEFMG